MSNQTRPPVRKLDGAAMTGQQRAPQPPRQTPRQPEFSARPLDEYADEPQDGYDAEHDAPDVAAPAPPRRPPPPAAGPSVGEESDESVVVFSRPYMAHGDEVRRIRLRRPVTKDIRQIGNPLVFDTNERGGMVIKELNLDRVARYVVALSEPPLPPSTVDQLDYFDLDACSAVIAPFFVRFA